MFLVWPFLSADGAADVIDAFGRHARRVVYLSSAGVGSRAEEEPCEAIILLPTELERLIEASGLEWTALRPTGFAGNALGWAEEIRTTGVVRAPMAAPARPLIHEADTAAVAVRALTTDTLIGARPLLAGPEFVTQERRWPSSARRSAVPSGSTRPRWRRPPSGGGPRAGPRTWWTPSCPPRRR
ncbi:hypothetical protein SNE510_34380 [Streptomyces sp. NE5-10]|uniref:SDR family oxidoreductase n=1 Tax=Streptomyces sp. NE5-10 TaxID=2759674 RepID=UPI001A5A0B91|nr:NAD(P)H-binding protein [Streptomyces sp. NE5-10]GHJ93919.1 hypothetical protein SNE510_34380 [Streptomyces sp. NE5-10]